MPLYGTTTPDPGTYQAHVECSRCGIEPASYRELRAIKHGDWAGRILCQDCRDVERPARIRVANKPAPRSVGTSTHCRRGHPRTEENTIWQKDKRGMQRTCRICRRMSQDAYWARKRAAV